MSWFKVRVNRQPSTVNRPPSTVHCPLPHLIIDGNYEEVAPQKLLTYTSNGVDLLQPKPAITGYNETPAQEKVGGG